MRVNIDFGLVWAATTGAFIAAAVYVQGKVDGETKGYIEGSLDGFVSGIDAKPIDLNPVDEPVKENTDES